MLLHRKPHAARAIAHLAVIVLGALWITAGGAALAPQAEAATLVARVDLSSQRMQVFVDGRKRFTWRVSTGRRGWRTPAGTYQPWAMKPRLYSKRFRMQLSHVIWIDTTGIAIHGTTRMSRLGRTASHGCIRLALGNARTFYRMVKQHGLWNTSVVVHR
ncbi:MAG: L,D-transpeptidase [Pseudomonadota bacterium]